MPCSFLPHMGERGLDDIEGAEIVDLELIAYEIHSLS